MSSNSSVTVIIPGSLEFLRVVDRVSDTVTEALGFSENERDAVALSVIEACTNAIEHGCKCNESKNVTITYVLMGDRVKVTVADPGAGFGTAGARCVLGESVEERGRGFAIIKALMDEVAFDFDNGTSITMVKRKSEAQERAGT